LHARAARLLSPGLLEECADSFEGTCLVESVGNGVGAAGGCGWGYASIEWIPSFGYTKDGVDVFCYR
jgi:hypothetical protein